MSDREYRVWFWSLHATFAVYVVAGAVSVAGVWITLFTGPVWLWGVCAIACSVICFLLLSGLWIKPWRDFANEERGD